MSDRIFRYEDPDQLVIGTIGIPGEREFFLQVGKGNKVSSFALEKGQADGLARRSLQMLQDLQLKKTVEIRHMSLLTPLESEFQIGVITITWKSEIDRFDISIEALSDQNDADETSLNDFDFATSQLQVLVSPDLLNEFAQHTLEVVAAGRQPCLFCGGPINSEGHLCPRANGYRRME